MNCPRCQHENSVGVKFCGECGARLEAACPACGIVNPPGNKFCGQCGALLVTAIASTKFASPKTYTPKHLAEKILTSTSTLAGERKQITVLFADIKGSMELLADRDPEEARKLLDPVLEHMIQAVHRYEGTVNQVMGDGIMALFGAPLAHEDHAVRACYAALRAQESVKRYAEGVRHTEGITIQIRVGLNSGEVVVGSISNDLKMDYTAVGQTTHLAARMEQMAMPGSILMTLDTLRLAEGFVQVKSIGPVSVKGLSQAVEVYEVTGAGPVRSRLKTAAAGGLNRFVGRDTEIDQLYKALKQAEAGHGQVVAVVGEPGVGKSRLFYEFTHSHRTGGCVIVESGAVSYRKATPYVPVIDLLNAYFKIQDGDNQRDIREKLTAKLLTLDKSLESTLPAFLALLDLPVEDAYWQGLDPPHRRQRTFDAVKRLLLKQSQVQSLVLVFEDLHWIDSETQALLDNLVEALPTARLLLLVDYRPEYHHAWANKTYYTQLRIDPLSRESAEGFLRDLVGNDIALQPLKDSLVERTEGNPFFLEEIVRTLVETKVLGGERGAYHLTKPLEEIQVPATVQAVLAARIDRLPPEEKQFLQSASVIGENIPFTLLQVIAETSEEQLRRGFAHLQAAEFVYETSVFPELEYTFRHGLTYQVAYNSLLQERRRALHARLVTSIESIYADRITEQVERLAHHAVRGEVWNKAVVYLCQAGKKAASRFANREAVGYFEQALEAMGHLPEGREKSELSIDVRLDLRPSMLPLGAQERMIEHLTQAESLAVRLGDKWRLARVYADLNAHYVQFGENLLAIRPGERALAIANELEDFALQLMVQDRLARAYYGLGDYCRFKDLLNHSLSLLEDKPVGERFGLTGIAYVITRVGVVSSLTALGRFAEAIVWGEEAVRVAEMVSQPFSRVAASSHLADLYITKGDIQKALPLLEHSLLVLQDGKVPVFSSQVKASIGFVYLHSGRTAEALPLLEDAAERPTMARFYTLHLCWLGVAYLVAERKEEAIKVALRALSRARDKKERGHEAWVLRLLGEITAHADTPDVENSQDHYCQALALAEELGMRPLIAHCHVGLGKLYRRSGNLPLAKEHLRKGIALMREMEMGFWLGSAQAGMKEFG